MFCFVLINLYNGIYENCLGFVWKNSVRVFKICKYAFLIFEKVISKKLH